LPECDRWGHRQLWGYHRAVSTATAPAGSPAAAERHVLADGELLYWASAFTAAEADRLQARLRGDVDWQAEQIVMFGRLVPVPRLVAWHGDPAAVYSYSGVRHEPSPWLPAIADVRRRVEALTGETFNSVLLNLYRCGRDGMGWHADDEPELGRNPLIASVSFGATRRFRLKHRRRAGGQLALDLAHGSLLVMRGALQHHWLHAVPKTRTVVGERINLTFRRVEPSLCRHAGTPPPPISYDLP
jgi:alkylated DNA repair dioxygenase AlkB